MGLQKPAHCNRAKSQVPAQHGGETKQAALALNCQATPTASADNVI